MVNSNYDAGSVAEAEAALAKAKVSTKIMIDTSHANSNKDPFLQPLVLKNITEQIIDGNKSIIGIMVESHLKGGRQEIPENLCDLEYGKSVTDGCIDWDTTEKVLLRCTKHSKTFYRTVKFLKRHLRMAFFILRLRNNYERY